MNTDATEQALRDHQANEDHADAAWEAARSRVKLRWDEHGSDAAIAAFDAGVLEHATVQALLAALLDVTHERAAGWSSNVAILASKLLVRIQEIEATQELDDA